MAGRFLEEAGATPGRSAGPTARCSATCDRRPDGAVAALLDPRWHVEIEAEAIVP